MTEQENGKILNAHRVLWNNGSRPFLIAGFLTIAAMLALSAALFGLTVAKVREGPATSPIVIRSITASNMVLHTGEKLRLTADSCNESNGPLALYTAVTAIRTLPSRVIVPLNEFGNVKPQGCQVSHLDLPLPLMPGTWTVQFSTQLPDKSVAVGTILGVTVLP